MALLAVAGISTPQASSFLCVTKKEPKSASADSCPAELTALLRSYVQTAAGNMRGLHEQ